MPLQCCVKQPFFVHKTLSVCHFCADRMVTSSYMRKFRTCLSILFLASVTLLLTTNTGCAGGTSRGPAPKSLTSIDVSPTTTTLGAVGATQQFTATGHYSDGTTAVLATATWGVGDTSVAAINATGLATAIAAGSTSVTASFSGMSGTGMLTVSPSSRMVTSIVVSPAAANIAVGATQLFSATANYSDGSVSDVTASATWSVTSSTIATISGAGLATAVASGTATVTATYSSFSASGSLTVSPALTSISISPGLASMTVGQQRQFKAMAAYSDGSSQDITSTATWSSNADGVATVNAGLATSVSAGVTTFSAALSGVRGTATLDVAIGTNVPTFHVDAQRSGLNSGETILTSDNVVAGTFGKLFSYLVDGYVYGEPLLVSNLMINGTLHNVLFVATEQDTVYALDADNYGPPLWQVSLLQPGETPLLNGPIQPFEGVTSTPAIDLNTGVLYVVSTQTSAAGSGFRLNALNVLTGAQVNGGPVPLHATVPGTNATTLTASCLQRAALLIADGSVFIGFSSCASGWLLAYDEQTLAQTGVFNASPNIAGEGKFASAGGIWMGGGGPAADSNGSIYVTTGNGPFNPAQQAYGDSVLRFNAQLQLQDYFVPEDHEFMNCSDADLSAGGLLLIPGSTHVVAGGKTGKIYLLNTGSLGQEQPNDVGAAQTLWFEPDLSTPFSKSCTDPQNNVWTTDVNSYEIFGTAAYFNGSVYLGITPTSPSTPAPVRQFLYSGTLTPGPFTTPSSVQNDRGTTPFISANGATDGIVWMIDHGHPLQGGTPTSATLRAYDANLASELYNSNTAGAADVPGYGIKFTSPIAVNGKVYISTGHDLVTAQNPQGEIDVYGLK